MSFGFVEPWHLFLPRDGGHVISVMGSGGKTSILRAFAGTYRDLGIPVVVTTTTRSEPLPGMPAMNFSELEHADCGALPDVFFLHGGVTGDDKWAGLAPAAVDALGGRLPDRVVLVEVDGSASLPVKLYRDDEPVWPRRTSLAVVVMGTAAVGSPTGEVLHRFGVVDWPPLAGLKEWTVWEWDHARTLLLSGGGYLSRVPAGIPCVLALTGMDVQADSIGLFQFVGQTMENERLPLTMFCDFGQTEPVIRTACNLAPEEA